MQDGQTKIQASGADLFLYGQNAVGSLRSYIQLGAEIQIIPKSDRDTRIYGRGLRINRASYISSILERLSVDGRTAVKGANTFSTSTAFEIYDGDTTPTKLWDFRNNGNLIGSGKRITNTIVNP